MEKFTKSLQPVWNKIRALGNTKNMFEMYEEILRTGTFFIVQND